MAGLREDKKRQTLLRIMESAKHIFSQKGFQQASMIEIAKEAEVGTGTIYNYFPSKGALLLRIFSEEAELIQKNDQHFWFTHLSEVGVVDKIIQFLHQFTEFFSHYPKAFWRDLFHVMTEEVEESIRLRDGLFGLDEQVMELIKSMIKSEEGSFLFPVNAEEASYAIYGAVLTDTMLYIYNESMTNEQYKEQITRHIQFIFAGKINQRNGES
ncbi:TetR/AcrR family transcriptional regulator [Ornithinibacillus xuwenensis]|uniref:TetR/AcrR family transcriptional regulator n=1 Tax=Ornithinibacillus xuwenensis TaxID=3144668 RepID=A0ABU9XIM8_9BACI